MSRKRDSFAEAPGQDSFLDVVANMVGILIILIILIGARAKDAAVLAATEDQQPEPTVEDPLAKSVASLREEADAIESDVNQTYAKIQRGNLDVEFRKAERDRVHVLVTVAEQELEKQREKLTAKQQEQFDAARKLIAAQDELTELQKGRDFFANSEGETAVIEHLPTPMAKTVFGKEVHFRMKAGKLTLVPWEDVVERLKTEIPTKIARLRDAPQYSDTIGPIAGYWLKYSIRRTERRVQTNAGAGVQSRIELERFVLLPMNEDFGESLEDALKDGSQLRAALYNQNPSRTTVTVWVYPDSYEEFRKLKRILFDMGYLTAARPLPEGYPIGGSPEGSRSAAQ